MKLLTAILLLISHNALAQCWDCPALPTYKVDTILVVYHMKDSSTVIHGKGLWYDENFKSDSVLWKEYYYKKRKKEMNTQNGQNTSIYGLSITAFLTIISHVTLNDVLTVCAILAALTTAAVNIKNYLKK